MDVGFIGLGVMGTPMAGHLVEAGHTVFAHSRRGVPAGLGSVTSCASAREVAEKAEVIVLMLPDTSDVEAVLFGDDGVIEGVSSGKLVIDMSSISPEATRKFAGRLAAVGVGYVDAPVSGGEVGAKNASLTIMVGAADKDFVRALPLLEKLGQNITHIGQVGAGQVAKIANQIVVGLTIQAVSEALVLAAKAGVDPARVREALMGGFAASRILEVHGKRMIDRTFAPGFRIALHRKDLGLALESGRELGVALPNTAMCHQMMNAAIAAGNGNSDHSALVTIIEGLADHSLESKV
jgi:2-hydroxy-3-oxopropionate reductase